MTQTDRQRQAEQTNRERRMAVPHECLVIQDSTDEKKNRKASTGASDIKFVSASVFTGQVKYGWKSSLALREKVLPKSGRKPTDKTPKSARKMGYCKIGGSLLMGSIAFRKGSKTLRPSPLD